MNKYRSHNCSELRSKDANKVVKLSGWIHRKRDHGNLLFLDLRDHYGLTQCVIQNDSNIFKKLESLKQESVVTISGKVVERSKETVNQELPTGKIEVVISDSFNNKLFSNLLNYNFFEETTPIGSDEITLKKNFVKRFIR